MKKWLPVFLCCFAANAFASSADSGRCPWKIPFTIRIHAAGGLHIFTSNSTDPRQYPNTDYGTGPATNDFVFTVDTSASFWKSIDDTAFTLRYSLNGDILQFFMSYSDTLNGPFNGMVSSSITFAPGKDSIIDLNYQESTKELPIVGIAMPEIDHNFSFQISSLQFDDTSIFTTDSSFSGHNISMTYFETDVYYNINDVNKDFTASSVDLSGIFRPTHFADPSSVVEAIPPSTDALSVISLNGSLRCSFGASDEERLLEIYSLLGMRVAQYSISPGQEEAIIPRITPGFYFVRLGNALTKILVAK